MIHEWALVENPESIGKGTKVWQFASIIRGAVVGRDCTIGPGTKIDGAIIGDRCNIQDGCSINPGVKIGNEVFVGPNVTFCNDAYPFVDKTGMDFSKFDGTRFTIIVDDGAIIGAGAVIMPGRTVGKGAVVAAGSRVEEDVPPGMIYQRNGYIGSIPTDWRERRQRWAK